MWQSEKAIAEAESRIGRIDVLVDAAGYAYLVAIEEGEDKEIRAQFRTNVFGLDCDDPAGASPHAQAAKRPHRQLFLDWRLGRIAAAGCYHATKVAVEGLSESLWREVKPLGIRVTIVEPGCVPHRLEGSFDERVEDRDRRLCRHRGQTSEQTRNGPGKQPGEMVRAAEASFKAVTAETPPLRLLLGKQALKTAYEKRDSMRDDFDAWQDTTKGADFPRTESK